MCKTKRPAAKAPTTAELKQAARRYGAALERESAASRRLEEAGARRLPPAEHDAISARYDRAMRAIQRAMQALRAAGLHGIESDGKLYPDLSFDLGSAFAMRDEQMDVAVIPVARLRWDASRRLAAG